MSTSETYFNGMPATADDLAPLAFTGYAHFTAMQVRNNAVRGLDLHLERLCTASDELFGAHLPEERILDLLASAVRCSPPDVSLTCYITSRPGEFMRSQGSMELDVVVKVTAPAAPSSAPLALAAYQYERFLPHLKHVGEVAKTQLLRRANAQGFDDAVFTDASGYLSEATIWNLVFWDGQTLIWPDAHVLQGVTMQIVQRQLDASAVMQVTRPVHESEATALLSGAVMNSWTPGIPLASIAGRPLARADELMSLLHQAYASEPPIAL